MKNRPHFLARFLIRIFVGGLAIGAFFDSALLMLSGTRNLRFQWFMSFISMIALACALLLILHVVNLRGLLTLEGGKERKRILLFALLPCVLEAIAFLVVRDGTLSRHLGSSVLMVSLVGAVGSFVYRPKVWSSLVAPSLGAEPSPSN